MSALADIVERLRESRGFRHKGDISRVLSRLPANAQGIAAGDDCAAIPDGDGYLLFAIEGLVSDFVHTMPRFAGYSGVMVNVSDIYAMGGRPIAVVDALWSGNARDADEVLAGMTSASAAYGVPIVGGHSNVRSDGAQLAVAIVGRARKLLTSFDARPGDALVMAVDLRGTFEEPYPFWNASVGAPAGRARADFELLPAIAEDGLCDAAKDISMAGTLGTALMLLECSNAGARIDLDALPRPAEVDIERWLTAFPSFGFVLSVRREHVDEVLARFASRELACAVIGEVDASREVVVERGSERALLWNLREEPFICAR
ncbi:sll0787 family AIR synthase-like protein [Caballeronia sp. J97]|uniref:sll0787 family AIR synthase-like protein n=1 Tax=Caballeronia sp. J97 TaxID=2805429 RepID=UPI002AB113F2|nr:sll0787 family AIR synthase-like protein [Caballeronia sp. J97]